MDKYNHFTEDMLGAVYIALMASIFFTRAKRSS